MQGHGDVVPSRLEDVAAQAGLRSEADGMQQAVQGAPALTNGLSRCLELLGLGHVRLDHLDGSLELAGGAPGER